MMSGASTRSCSAIRWVSLKPNAPIQWRISSRAWLVFSEIAAAESSPNASSVSRSAPPSDSGTMLRRVWSVTISCIAPPTQVSLAGMRSATLPATLRSTAFTKPPAPGRSRRLVHSTLASTAAAAGTRSRKRICAAPASSAACTGFSSIGQFLAKCGRMQAISVR